MPLPNFIKSIFSGGAGELVEKIGNAFDANITNKEELIKAKSEAEKVVLDHLQGMESELTKQMESEDKAITERWKADMESDSWLSKNTRPLVMLSLLAFLFILIFCDSAIKEKFEVKESYITLMETLLVTVTVAYFGSRGVEKFKSIHESTKRK